MKLSKKAKNIHEQLSGENVKLGDIRKIAEEIKKDHELAIELWTTAEFFPQQLAILIMDKKLLTEKFINKLAADIQEHESTHRTQLADWLMANQLAKDKKTISLMLTWEENQLPILRRLFWYYQARLRWTGKVPPEGSGNLLSSIEKKMANEEPEVQWAMNFTAGWIGIHEPEHRSRCIALGEKIGLYKDQVVSKGCTPNYLPEFIRIEAAKLNR